mmetsp:Transcript_95544/g.183541  ORF Transcript_95544/g.183541 Transcript_95544/m.183541 type:complete len:173 (-) Transcript_95544:144-662(-)
MGSCNGTCGHEGDLRIDDMPMLLSSQKLDCCRSRYDDEDGPQTMMVTSTEALRAGRIDEWSTLADEQPSMPEACSCIPRQKAKTTGLRHFVADVPDGDQIMVVDDGIPLWVDDKDNSKQDGSSAVGSARNQEESGLAGMRLAVNNNRWRAPEEEEQASDLLKDMRRKDEAPP